MVTRFNYKTWWELQNFKRKNGITNPIYASPIRINQQLPIKGIVLVLEMRNDINKIMGVSLIMNYIYADRHYHIYSEGNYNRYIYKGKYRIDREEMNIKEEKIMQLLDAIVFKGYDHVKRGQGIARLPEKKSKGIKIDNKSLGKCIKDMFIERNYV